MMKNRKVLLLGLDGACFDFIDPLIQKGKLPIFKKLIDKGVRASLKSTSPPVTIPAWVSMFSGLSEGKLGCFGQQRWEKSRCKLEPVSILFWKGKLIWDIVSETKRVGVFRIQTLPRSYPINGFMITDIYSWDGSTYGNVYPPNLFDELKDFWLDMETEVPILNSTKIKLAFKNFLTRIEVANYLLKHEKVDLFVLTTRIPDIISHFTTDLGKIRLAYRIIGDGLSELIAQAESMNYNVIIISDHGTGRQVNKGFCVNNWLATYGFLTKNNEEKRITQNLSIFLKGKIAQFFKGRGLSPLLRSILNQFNKKTGKGERSESQWEDLIQWENTKALSFGGGGTNYTCVQILRKDLFPYGIVDSEEYEDLRNELCNKLKRYKDPQTGLSVIDEVFLKEEIFHGDNMHLMPDIILRLKKNYEAVPSFASSILSSNKGLIHTENGIFIANGPVFGKGLDIEEIDIVDIAPMILHILDIPIPTDIDGKVLRSVFDKESQLVEKKIEYQKPRIREYSPITEREGEEIKERLKALGYI